MNYLIFFLLFSHTILGSPGSSPNNEYSAYEITYTSLVSSPGLNPETYEPLTESDWLVFITAPGRDASDYADSRRLTVDGREEKEYIFQSGSQEDTFVEYVNPTQTCENITILEDPENSLQWLDNGLVRSREAGIETFNCSLASNTCPEIGFKRVSEERVFSTITSGAGENGTNPGNVQMLVAGITGDVSTETNAGTGGLAGDDDLIAYTDGIKRCVQIRDYYREPDTIYASNPSISVFNIDWVPVKSSQTSQVGNDGVNTLEPDLLFEGFDSSMIYWLEKENIIEGVDR